MSIKKILYFFYFSTLKKIAIISLKINSPFIFFLIFILQIYKRKEIQNSKSIKKLFVLSKTGGNDDIIASLRGGIPKKKIIFSHRLFFRLAHNYFIHRDVDISKNIKIEKILEKKNYKKFIENFLNYTKSYFGEIEFVTFNFNYHELFMLQYLCNEKKINFYICLKECVKSDKQFNIEYHSIKNLYKNLNYITKISTYNDLAKKYLLKYKLFKSNKIKVTGFPRLPNIKDKGKDGKFTVTFFMIDFALMRSILNKSSLKHKEKPIIEDMIKTINRDTLEIFLLLAKNNPEINFNIKGKTGNWHQKREIDKMKKFNHLKNINFYFGGTGHNLILNSSVIIGFNSTTIYEAMCLNKNVVVPYFKRFRVNKIKNYIFKYPSTVIADDKNDLNKKLNLIIGGKTIDQHKNLDAINYYLGDFKNAKKNLRNFLNL
ncbi:hypothetical protein [Candidatus Pelagibacter sp.]|uniref:hypothetical protein n=1 Tax=Candidatus Pelagibacter sp. TaxID=2024849 RepID=UPI003F834262